MRCCFGKAKIFLFVCLFCYIYIEHNSYSGNSKCYNIKEKNHGRIVKKNKKKNIFTTKRKYNMTANEIKRSEYNFTIAKRLMKE